MAFQHDFQGGRFFATDSNQGVRGAVSGGGNNTSRIVEVGLPAGTITTMVRGLPTGDHPTEQILVKDNWVYWSQGSATNAGVTGHDNGGGGNQHEIACQQITLSQNVWNSGDGQDPSGYSNHGVARPGAVVPAFEGATRQRHVHRRHPAHEDRQRRHHAEPSSRWRGASATRHGIRFSPPITR